MEVSNQQQNKTFEGLRKIISSDGWITPYGNFYACSPQEHDICAQYLVRAQEHFVKNQLEKNNEYQMPEEIFKLTPREVLKKAGFALLSDNLLVESNLPENLSIKQLELFSRAHLSLPIKEDWIDFETYKEFKELITPIYQSLKSKQKDIFDDNEVLTILKSFFSDPTTTYHNDDDHGSPKEAFDIMTKDYIAEQVLTESKGTRTWRMINIPSGKEIIMEFVFHDHADGDENWTYGYEQESWISITSKQKIEKFLSENLHKHNGWDLSGSLDQPQLQ